MGQARVELHRTVEIRQGIVEPAHQREPIAASRIGPRVVRVGDQHPVEVGQCNVVLAFGQQLEGLDDLLRAAHWRLRFDAAALSVSAFGVSALSASAAGAVAVPLSSAGRTRFDALVA